MYKKDEYKRGVRQKEWEREMNEREREREREIHLYIIVTVFTLTIIFYFCEQILLSIQIIKLLYEILS
jgi:hypothetical protein